jgi:dTMP kinase
MGRGKYIVIEGHDGTGKSTQVTLIRKKLKNRGISSIEFHEPEGTPIANAIRSIIKNAELKRDATTNMLLFNALRHEIWVSRALPALEAGKWVVASRNYFSTLAYQGYGEGLDLDLITNTTKIATDDDYMNPDIAIILDLDNEQERQKRITNRGLSDNPDTFESKDSDFQQRVKDGYLSIAKDKGIRVVSASQSIEDVQTDLWQIIEKSL